MNKEVKNTNILEVVALLVPVLISTIKKADSINLGLAFFMPYWLVITAAIRYYYLLLDLAR